ncbi:serine protease [Streptomyces sp. Li-HN-5-11]|uniref:S1 family peptidase n=1 Tax=Streptomyces sp. Li-HN-5-11 TaxID=3075432 RepID=UPI0028AAD84D|nr:serine protease [Streptomyces sp. Li-HN-5-11]WNM34425.1 serine protease [Streptomyces sp. Li-HN-5-11]
MALHHHSDCPWRVRVDDEQGNPCGAGVLLDDWHVLTCAHVVRFAGAEPGGPAARVRISSVACRPEWTRTARVAPGSWVHENGTRRGDVALLELDESAGCGTRTTLWKVPISGGTVRVYGFPQAEPYGIGTDAELAGSGGRQGEWGLLKQLRAGDPWIEEGYSGAGVVALDGRFEGRVIGMVVADFVNGDARAAWMLPTETVLTYLPQIREFTGGDRTDELAPSAGELPGDVLGDPLRLALTRELTRLLDDGWAGTVVVRTSGSTGVGDSWLVRLVRTADPAARATVSDEELTRAPGDTVLRLGSIDAAYDARGRTVAEVRDYLAGRFGLEGGSVEAVVGQLLHRTPPACLVVGSVDLADDPDALVRELLGPLAFRARSRGLRLVLGFVNRPPGDLPHEVSLDPEPLIGATTGRVTSAEAQAAVGQLAAEEEAAARLQEEKAWQYFRAPRLPQAAAPRLRVRLSVARTTEPNPELGAVHDEAVRALAGTEDYGRAVRRMIRTHQDLSTSLELHRVRAARYFGDEDRRLGELHAPAARALQTVPIDLKAARKLVRRYTDEVNRRIDEG